MRLRFVSFDSGILKWFWIGLFLRKRAENEKKSESILLISPCFVEMTAENCILAVARSLIPRGSIYKNNSFRSASLIHRWHMLDLFVFSDHCHIYANFMTHFNEQLMILRATKIQSLHNCFLTNPPLTDTLSGINNSSQVQRSTDNTEKWSRINNNWSGFTHQDRLLGHFQTLFYYIKMCITQNLGHVFRTDHAAHI